MLMHDGELRDRIAALVRDVGPLATVSAIGFADDDAERVKRAVGVVACASWRFADLAKEEPKQALDRALAGRPEVVVVRTPAKTPAKPLSSLVRAVIDKNIERPEGVTIVLLCEGASSIQEVEEGLRRIPYWDFVP